MSNRGEFHIVTGSSTSEKSRHLLQECVRLLPNKRVYGLVALLPEVYEDLKNEVQGVTTSLGGQEEDGRSLIRVREGLRSCLRWLHLDRGMIAEDFDCVMLDLNLGLLDRVACESVILPHIEYFRRAGITVWVTYDWELTKELSRTAETTWFGTDVTSYIEV